MIIGFDGIAYPCDSIKYFNELGISGNIRENSLSEMYNSEYFTNIRNLNVSNSVHLVINIVFVKVDVWDKG